MFLRATANIVWWTSAEGAERLDPAMPFHSEHSRGSPMSSPARQSSMEPTTADIDDAIGKASTAIRENPERVSFSVDHAQLQNALRKSIKPTGGPSNGGLDNHMWAAVVDRTGIVRAVCYSGNELGDQWPGSRSIAIEKANTANGLSLPKFAS